MKELKISVDLPADIPEDEGTHRAQKIGKESAVVALWQAGHLSTREAAQQLRCSYREYLDFLGERGIPVAGELSDEDVMQKVVAELRAHGHLKI